MEFGIGMIAMFWMMPDDIRVYPLKLIAVDLAYIQPGPDTTPFCPYSDTL